MRELYFLLGFIGVVAVGFSVGFAIEFFGGGHYAAYKLERKGRDD